MAASSEKTSRLSNWLEAFGFKSQPFALHEADQERDFLPQCFVDRPYLDNILGNPARPQTAVLTAGSGEGKTATREMVVYECLYGKLRGRVLPLRYDRFEYLLSLAGGDPAQITLAHHVKAILRLLFQTLREDVPPTYYEGLDDFETGLLLDMAGAYADPVSRLWLRQVLKNARPGEAVDWEAMTPVEALFMAVGLVCKLGLAGNAYQAVYILVDRADEIRRGDEAACFRALEPLVREGALLNRPGLAFKFFLPPAFADWIRAALPISPDKVIFERVDWTQDILLKVINQRIRYFSGGKKEHVAEIFTHEIRRAATYERLAEKSGLSPRALLRLYNYMVQSHLEREETVDTQLLDRVDLNNALTQFDHDVQVTLAQRQAPLRGGLQPAEAPAQAPASGLHIDGSEHVWVDGQPISSSLSRQEFKLLTELHRFSPRPVSTEDLIMAVWPANRLSSESPDGGRYDEQNLRKLVDRLRDKLKTGSAQPKDRFIKNARGRGYYLVCK